MNGTVPAHVAEQSGSSRLQVPYVFKMFMCAVKSPERMKRLTHLCLLGADVKWTWGVCAVQHVFYQIHSLLHIPNSWLKHWHGLLVGLQQPEETWMQTLHCISFCNFCPALHGLLMDLTLVVCLWGFKGTWNCHEVDFHYDSSFYSPPKNLRLSRLLSFWLNFIRLFGLWLDGSKTGTTAHICALGVTVLMWPCYECPARSVHVHAGK